MTRIHHPFLLLCLLLIGGSLTANLRAADLATIERSDGGEAGLVVLLEPTSPNLAIDLAKTGRHIAITLSADAARASELDQAFAKASVHPVADSLHWRQPAVLPFQNHAINVLILSQTTAQRLGEAEIKRVLVPGHGLALIDGREVRKPRPDSMDTWLGHHRDGTGNRSSRDTYLQPPNSIQWMMGPRDVRGNDPHIVTDRIHFIQHNWLNSGNFQQTTGRTAHDAFARDAFTGVTRWSKPHNGGSYLPWGLISFSDGQRLYMPRHRSDLEMKVLDIRTGEVLLESLPHLKWADHFTGQGRVRLQRRVEAFTNRVITDGKRIYHVDGGNVVRAMSADGKELLWERTFEAYTDMAATDGKTLAVVLSSTFNFPVSSMRNFTNNTNTAKAIVGLDPATGEQRWRYDGVDGFPLMYMILDHGTVVASSHLDAPHRARESAHPLYPTHAHVAGNILVSLDAATGRENFRRTDFADLNNGSLRQSFNVLADRIVLHEEAMAYVVDRRTGKPIHAHIDLGSPRNGWWPTTPNWIISNGLFVSHDGSVRDDAAHHITWPQYSAAAKVANGMYYVPPGLETIGGTRHLGQMMPLSRQELPQPMGDDQRLLVRGRAEGVAEPAAADWPTFRGDFQRRAWRATDGPATLELAWEARIKLPEAAGNLDMGWLMNSSIPGSLTPPVADAKYVLVAVPDSHRLVCYALSDGSERWSINLGARITSPPTLGGGVAFVGVNDGTVSAINLEDGRVIWTFLAAPYERLIHAHHQIESTHPVFTPILHKGTLYVNAGRHGRADNGIFLWALDPATGAVQRKHTLTEPHINDVMQMISGRIRLARSSIDPATLAVSADNRTAAPSIIPDEEGKVGGTGWIRLPAFYRGYRLYSHEGVRSGGIMTQLDDGFGIYARGRYHEVSLDDHNTSRKEIPVGDIANMHMAGAGRYHYVAGRNHGSTARFIRVAVIDTVGGKATTVEVPNIVGHEDVVTDGIAIAHGHVIVTTTAGRVLAFRAP